MSKRSKRNRLLYGFKSPITLIYAFFSISYGGVEIAREIIQEANDDNGEIAFVTGYLNISNKIQLTVTISDDEYNTYRNGYVVFGVAFSKASEIPSTSSNFSEMIIGSPPTCCNAEFENSTTAQITLTRGNLIDSFSQLQNNGCNNLCDDGNPRFDLWFKLAESAVSAEAGWREINWPDNNVPDYGGGEVQDYLIYDPWDPYISMRVYIRGDFHGWNNTSFTNQQFQFTIYTHPNFGNDGLFDPLGAHNGVANVVTFDGNSGIDQTYTIIGNRLTNSNAQTIDLDAGTFVNGVEYDFEYEIYDLAGNKRNGTDRWNVTYDDEAPQPVITGLIGDDAEEINFTGTFADGDFINDDNPIYLKIVWQEDDGSDEDFGIRDFGSNDIEIDNNATLGKNGIYLVWPTVANDFYYIPVTLSDNGLITVQIDQNEAVDYAGNNNTAATAFTFNYDDIHPTLIITAYHGADPGGNALTQGSTYNGNNDIVFNFAWTDVNDVPTSQFYKNRIDQNINIGFDLLSAPPFVKTSNKPNPSYTLTLEEDLLIDNSMVRVLIKAGEIQDEAGNALQTDEVLSFFYDNNKYHFS